MKTLDNTIKYYELIMTYNDTSRYEYYQLPAGFHFAFYEDGDEEEWINIHIESGEFTSYEEGHKYFHNFFGHFLEDLPNRCIFIIDDETNQKIASVTISPPNRESNDHAIIDWLAITRAYQGKHLSKPLLSKAIRVANLLHHHKLILHTQTTTWLAVKIYLDFGFEILNKDETIGWGIIRTLTNHPKLMSFDKVDIKNVYDKRNIAIEKELMKIYPGEFNYSVWYKNNLHDIYVYYQGHSYQYEYFIENNQLKIIEKGK